MHFETSPVQTNPRAFRVDIVPVDTFVVASKALATANVTNLLADSFGHFIV